MSVANEPRGYAPNDFFWVSVKDYFSNVNCDAAASDASGTDCAAVAASAAPDERAARACYDAALCENKKYADSLGTARSTNAGADVRYSDTRAAYVAELQNAANMSAGIVAMVAFIYLYR
jgi:hypothetical protein